MRLPKVPTFPEKHQEFFYDIRVQQMQFPLSYSACKILHQMQFSQFRFASVHKQYLIFCGKVPEALENRYPGTANSFLTYCFYDHANGLSCFLLATTIFNEGNLTIVSDTPPDMPVILPADDLAEKDCTPVRRGVFDLSRYSFAEAEAEKLDPTQRSAEKIYLSRVCGVCLHHHGRSGWRTCPAFPEKIPDEIWNAETDPKVPCGARINFVPKNPRLFLEVFDAGSGRVVYRYEASGDPLCPVNVCESSDLGEPILAAFREMMTDWHTHVAEPVKELLHCTADDGAFIAELAAINVAMTINKQSGREVYRIIDEFPEYPNPKKVMNS